MAEGSSSSFPFVGGLALDEPEVVELSPEAADGWISGRQKRKRAQVLPHEIIELDDDNDFDGVTILGVKTSDHKNKQTVDNPMDWTNNAKFHSSFSEYAASPSVIPAEVSYPWDGLGTYPGGTMHPFYDLSVDVAGPSSIPTYEWNGLVTNHGGTLFPVYSNDFYATQGEYFPYQKDYNNLSYITPSMENGGSINLHADYYMGFLPSDGPESSVLLGGHMVPTDLMHQRNQVKIMDGKIDEKYTTFKQFDTIDDHSDHFYSRSDKLKVHAIKKPSKVWVKRIQHEWKVLEKDLPDTIFVRVYEDRMDLLRAVIVGPAGTPYHDGLFFFDVYFPSQYPSKPPLVNYRSGGLRLNPNLYACGKVCLSLLNTWSGNPCEMWNPSNSTMLQVLVSIQALVLNAKPYFNEPGYAMHANTPHGEKQSLVYNEETFLLSCRTMLYSLRNPPKHFENFIGGHFRKFGHTILIGCKAYISGAQVGCLVGDGVQDVDEGDKSCSQNFKTSLKLLFKELVREFTNLGVGCDEFQPQIMNPGTARSSADTTLRL